MEISGAQAKFRFEVYDDHGQYFSQHNTQLAASHRVERYWREHPQRAFVIRCKYSRQEFPVVDEDGDHVMRDCTQQVSSFVGIRIH